MDREKTSIYLKKSVQRLGSGLNKHAVLLLDPSKLVEKRLCEHQKEENGRGGKDEVHRKPRSVCGEEHIPCYVLRGRENILRVHYLPVDADGCKSAERTEKKQLPLRFDLIVE